VVDIQDIKNLADYNRSLAYLQKLSSVSAVHPYYLATNHAIFKLTTPQGRLGVARAIALGRTLASDAAATTNLPPQPQPGEQVKSNVIKPDLVYRLVP
jgi:hypothetical protein